MLIPEVSTVLAGKLAALHDEFGTGTFTSLQAQAMKVSRSDLHRLLRQECVASVFRGLYQVGAGPVDLASRASVVEALLPPGAAVARRTAAWLFGVDPRSPGERDAPMDVECVVPRGRVPLRRPSLRCYQADVAAADVVRVGGVTCTGPARTSSDLLRWLSPPMGLACADALSAMGLITAEAVLEDLSHRPGQRFVSQARRLATWIEPLTESFGETWLRLRILDAGFPRPTAQICVYDDRGRLVYRLDLGWPDLMVAIEYDGEEFHSGLAADRADEYRRRRLAKEFGWQVIGVGRGDVLGQGLQLERGVGELLGCEPQIGRRRW
jgi:hypothetical protein